jgi:hypothetical protein
MGLVVLSLAYRLVKGKISFELKINLFHFEINQKRGYRTKIDHPMIAVDLVILQVYNNRY